MFKNCIYKCKWKKKKKREREKNGMVIKMTDEQVEYLKMIDYIYENETKNDNNDLIFFFL